MALQQELQYLLRPHQRIAAFFSSSPSSPSSGEALLSSLLHRSLLSLASLLFVLSVSPTWSAPAKVLPWLPLGSDQRASSQTLLELPSILRQFCGKHCSDSRSNQSADQLIPRHKYCSCRERSEASSRARRLMSSEDQH